MIYSSSEQDQDQVLVRFVYIEFELSVFNYESATQSSHLALVKERNCRRWTVVFLCLLRKIEVRAFNFVGVLWFDYANSSHICQLKVWLTSLQHDTWLLRYNINTFVSSCFKQKFWPLVTNVPLTIEVTDPKKHLYEFIFVKAIFFFHKTANTYCMFPHNKTF